METRLSAYHDQGDRFKPFSSPELILEEPIPSGSLPTVWLTVLLGLHKLTFALTA